MINLLSMSLSMCAHIRVVFSQLGHLYSHYVAINHIIETTNQIPHFNKNSDDLINCFQSCNWFKWLHDEPVFILFSFYIAAYREYSIVKLTTKNTSNRGFEIKNNNMRI